MTMTDEGCVAGKKRAGTGLSWFARRAFLAVCACGLIVSPASASTATNGYVTGFVTTSAGVVFFFTNGTRTGSIPSCSNPGLSARWGLNATTAAGQAVLSVLMTAHSLRQIVTVNGTGTCVGDAEGVDIVVTNNVQ